MDEIIQASSKPLPGFKLQRVSGPPENPPSIFVGGVDDTLTSFNYSGLPSFTGCMRDLAYGYEYDTTNYYNIKEYSIPTMQGFKFPECSTVFTSISTRSDLPHMSLHDYSISTSAVSSSRSTATKFMYSISISHTCFTWRFSQTDTAKYKQHYWSPTKVELCHTLLKNYGR